MNRKTIKKYSSLAHGKYREKYRLFLTEGRHTVEELLTSDYRIESIITSNGEIFEEIKSVRPDLNIELVAPSTVARIATTETPQEILAVSSIPERRDFNPSTLDRIIIADGIKDPGNLGTLIRTARAFGFDMMITTTDSVDIYNPKVIRSSQGALFGIGMLAGVNADWIIGILKPTHSFYSLATDGKTEIYRARPGEKTALVIGAEIQGVSRAFLDISDFTLKIPHSEEVDSLNVAVAAGIAMFVFNLKSQADLS